MQKIITILSKENEHLMLTPGGKCKVNHSLVYSLIRVADIADKYEITLLTNVQSKRVVYPIIMGLTYDFQQAYDKLL